VHLELIERIRESFRLVPVRLRVAERRATSVEATQRS
jgi:hypothetical protein